MYAITCTCDGEVLYCIIYVHINSGYNIIKAFIIHYHLAGIILYLIPHGIMLLQYYMYISYYIQIIVLSYTIIILTLASMPLNNVVH